MRAKILVLGLIFLVLIACKKGIKTPYSPDRCPPMVVTSNLVRNHPMDIATILEVPIFTHYPSPTDAGHSEATFFIVVTETCGDGGCIEGKILMWNTEKPLPSDWGVLHLPLEPIEDFGTVTYTCEINNPGKPNIMQLCIDGVDWSGRRIEEKVYVPFEYDE